jgi:hypothetical protein
VAFGSNADNLVAGDTNFSNDIFVRDRQAGQTARVNLNASSNQAEGGQSAALFISADGRYVTFDSDAANLVSGDTNFKTDIFVHDISSLGSGSLRAFFDIDARRNLQGRFVYPWARAGNATLPIKLNQASAQTVTVNARIEGAGGTVTRVLIFAPGQTTQNLVIENPQTGANQRVNIALQIAGTAIAQGEQAGSEIALFFIPPESGRDLCYACAIWLLLSLLGAEDPFLTELCGNTTNSATLTGLGDTISTLRAVRDQILADTPTGRYYTALYYGHSPELSRIAATNPTILWESWETLEAWTPALQSLVAGQGNEATITQAMVNDLNSVLEQIEAAASPQLRLAIQREQNALNLPSFVGRTMDAAWAKVNQRQVSEVFLPLTSR